jgi:hypothetical protein
MDEQKNPRKRKSLAAILIMLAAISISASFTRLHGTPALLSGAAGGVLLVIGIAQLLKKG